MKNKEPFRILSHLAMYRILEKMVSKNEQQGRLADGFHVALHFYPHFLSLKQI